MTSRLGLLVLPFLLPLAPAASAGVEAIPFALSGECALCHANSPHAAAMRDETDAPIAPHRLWRSSMMANSSRDPLWRAVVAAEIEATPSRRREIEATCSRCHAPLAWAEAALAGEPAPGLAVLEEDSRRGDLARDGVSCTLCHRIAAEGLGEPESWSGSYPIDEEGWMFGPHEGVNTRPMRHHTDFVPGPGHQILDPALCATCHTLFTEPFSPQGELLEARLPEQTPYLEWRNSAFGDEGPGASPGHATCQDCHLPDESLAGLDIETAIARNPGGRDFGFAREREPFGRHALVGGNVLVTSMLRDEAARVHEGTPPDAFERSVALALRQLRRETTRVEVGEAKRRGKTLTLPVRVENGAGHKLPTGHPSRRAWIRLTVHDAAGKLVFASGEYDERGRLVDAAGRPLSSEEAGGPVQPHRALVSAPEETALFESVMADATGAPTYTLLRGTTYMKDNRLLPRGWREDGPGFEAIAPVGTSEDGDFSGGSDTVLYRFRAPRKRGPYRVSAELVYQPLGSRYADELFRSEAPEVARFRALWEAADPRPVSVARAESTVD
jgi:hypothetical protein